MHRISQSAAARSVITTLAAARAFGLVVLAVPMNAQTVLAKPAALEDDPIRPFQTKVPAEALIDLRRRIAATTWAERETVSDATQGVHQ